MLDAGTVTKRLGIEWCLVHQSPLAFCCRAAQPTHNWSGHNAMRKYAALMVKGQTHPFKRAGGKLLGVREDVDTINAALKSAPLQRVSLDALIATSDVQPQHLALVLRGTGPEPRTGNHSFESAEHPTVLRVGNELVLADGHHRAAAAWARGETKLRARVVDGLTPVFQNSDDLLLRPTG